MSNKSQVATGQLKHISAPEQKGNYTAQYLIVETKHGEWPVMGKFEFFGKKYESNIETLQGLQVGQQVEVLWDHNARQHNGNWYDSNQAWKVQVQNQEQPAF